MDITVSARVKKLNTRLQNEDYFRPLPWLFENVNILNTADNDWLKKEPIVIRKAYSIRYVAENLPLIVYDDEMIVGVPNQSSVEFGTVIPEYLTEEERKAFSVYDLNEYGLVGHHAPDWNLVLQKGTIGLTKDVDKALGKLQKDAPDYQLKKDELQAMRLSLEALDILSNRYAGRLEELANECSGTERKDELEKMAQILKKVPRNPAENLWEALQSFWITYVLLASNGEFLPLGRIDQYFKPYVQLELCESSPAWDETCDLIGSFLIKCNERNVLDARLLENKSPEKKKTGVFARNIRFYHEEEPETSENNKFFGQEANNRMMTAVVGGYLANKHDGTNVLSYLFLQMVDELHLLMPTLGVRINKNTPKELLKVVANILRHGQGEPVIYNDDAIIRNHDKLKVSDEDVVDYSSDGCWEVIFPGKDNFAYDNIYALQCLEWTMNDGRRIKTGEKDGLATKDISLIHSYEEFYENYLLQVKHQLSQAAENFVENVGVTAITSPDPLLSTLCSGCIDNGKDFLGKGAKYQHRMLLLLGFADTVDSLAAIKYMVFEQRFISLEELRCALQSNWNGFEEVRHIIRKSVPTFGNNDEYTDEIAVRFMTDYSEMLTVVQNKYKNVIFTGGIGTFHMYAAWGNMTGASPNGRGAYEPLAPNYSPVPGTNINGPLATIISSTKGDLSNFMTGTPVDIQINGNDFSGESGLERLMDIIQGFCELDGQIMTISSYSLEQLKDAKVHPEKYRDLRVRMGGLSAYFVQLAPVAQDKIIERFAIC